VAQEVLRAFRGAVAREVVGRPHHYEAERLREPHLHHVALDRLAEPHPCVVPLRHDVHEAIVDRDFDFDARMAGAKRGNHGVDDEGDGHARHRQPHATDDFPRLSRRLAQRDERKPQRRTRTLHEPPPRLRHRHAPGRAGQKHHAKLLLELSDRLADRGPGDTELARRAAETAQACHREECLKLRERSGAHEAKSARAGADCQAKLNRPSPRWRLVRRRQRAHVLRVGPVRAPKAREGGDAMSRKVWFITGAGRGMGVDFAKAALVAGHAVVASGRDADRTSRALGPSNDLLAVKLDVTRRADAEAAVRAGVDRLGRIDVLVNNAANFYAE